MAVPGAPWAGPNWPPGIPRCRKSHPRLGRLDEELFARLLAADPDAALALLADLARATDQQLREAARRLAARVFFRLARAGHQPARGTRRLAPGRADGDLDLDRTLDRWSGPWPPRDADLVTRSWSAHRRALCLLIDSSGSMSGLAVAIAAVAAASMVLASDGRLQPGIVAFSRQTRVLQAQGTSRRRPAGRRAGGAARARSDRSGRGTGRGGGAAGHGTGQRTGGRATVRLPADQRRGPGTGVGWDKYLARAVPAAFRGSRTCRRRPGPPRRWAVPAGARACRTWPPR